MKVFTFQTRIWLPRPLRQVFPFFADARNLQELTPSWLDFEILTPCPIEMRVGRLIDYRLRIRGVPIRWQSEISAWEPPSRFVDEQRQGPYRLWVHEHRFEAQDEGTGVEDVVRYAVRGGALINRLLVAPDLDRIFRYRHQRLRQIFGASPPAGSASQ
jgi:hypothetical protein